MNYQRVSVLIGCFVVLSCKTSNFRSTTENATPGSEDAKVNTSVPNVTTTTATANVPVTTSTLETSTTDLQLNQTCDKPVQLLMSQVKLTFDGRNGCKYGTDPNLPQLDAFLQAREISSKELALPENSEICSMTLESTPPNVPFQYDDFMVLTIDDFVIFSSNKDFIPKLTQMNGLYKWDFLKVRGMPVDFKALPYCIGAAERCMFPPTDAVGPVLMKLNYSEIAGIAKAIQGKVKVPFDLIATGDNDAAGKDCYHETLNLTVTMNYIKKPK